MKRMARIAAWSWALAGIGGFFAVEAAEVAFPDPVLEGYVREQIGKPEGAIQREELSHLTKISLYETDVRDLTGLEWCTNVTELNCQANKISNIESLAKMPQLERVWLSHNEVTGIGALRGLPHLADLSLGGNTIEDLTPLAGLLSLRRLVLAGIPIADPVLLAGLTGLEELYVSRTGISNLDFVAGMTGLKVLSAMGNDIERLEPLRGLHALMEIQLEYNAIEDISPLAGLEDVWWFNVAGNKISSLSELPRFRRNAKVQLYDNRISDIRPLVEACLHTGEVCIELGLNPLETPAFCRDIPELEARGNRVVFRRKSPEPESVMFPERAWLCDPAGPVDLDLKLAAVNRGATEEELAQLFGAPEVVDDGPTVVASHVVDASGPTAALAVTLADTEFNVSVESSGLDLWSLLGGIAFLGVLVLLVIAVKLPRVSR